MADVPRETERPPTDRDVDAFYRALGELLLAGAERRAKMAYIADRQRWAAVTPAPERRWFRFRTEEQAKAFLDAYLAALDPDVRRALVRALS